MKVVYASLDRILRHFAGFSSSFVGVTTVLMVLKQRLRDCRLAVAGLELEDPLDFFFCNQAYRLWNEPYQVRITAL